MHTLIRDAKTNKHDFVFYADRLIRLVWRNSQIKYLLSIVHLCVEIYAVAWCPKNRKRELKMYSDQVLIHVSGCGAWFRSSSFYRKADTNSNRLYLCHCLSAATYKPGLILVSFFTIARFFDQGKKFTWFCDLKLFMHPGTLSILTITANERRKEKETVI